MAEYFYDTYALIEYVNANKNFKKYFQEHIGVTNKLNLMELYYAMLKDISKEKAETAYESFLPITAEIEDRTIKNAMCFRLKEKARKLSYVDVAGYQIALEKGIKFLTGDKQFKEMKNVEFVK